MARLGLFDLELALVGGRSLALELLNVQPGTMLPWRAAVARALCNVAQATGPMRAAAFDSLQKVHPKLYPDAVTMI